MAKLVASMIDNSGEKSSVTIPEGDASGLDTFQAWLTDSANLLTNLEAISLMPVWAVTFTQETDAPKPAPPDVDYADRERAVRIYMQGNDSGKTFFISVPAPDEGALTRILGSDLYDLTQAPLSTFVTWLEANYTPQYGEAAGEPTYENVTVLRAKRVGRNN